MTLYLWMHWFWITFRIALALCSRSSLLMAGAAARFPGQSPIPPTAVFPVGATESTTKKHTLLQQTVIERNFTIPSIDNDTLSTTDQSYSENVTVSQMDYVDETDVSRGRLSAAGITGITVGCIGIVGIICGVSFFIYRNRGFNRPQVLNDRCSNPDSSGYIDDASIRDNSEEMYSLDNDSFLNSLEAMTIQNYWTDTVKHTKL